MTRFAVFFAGVVWLLAMHAPASGATLSEAEQALIGRWLHTPPSGDAAAARIFEIHSIVADGAGFKGEGHYGTTSSNEPVTLAIQPAGDEFAFRFSTRVTAFEFVTAGSGQLTATTVRSDGGTGRMTFKSAPMDNGVIFAPGAVPSLEDMERVVYGSWLVKVGKNPRPLAFDIREIEEERGAFRGKALWGWIDGTGRATPVAIAIKNGVIDVDFTSVTKARIQARVVAPDRMEGVLTQADGKSFWTTFNLSDEVHEFETVAAEPKAAAKAAPKAAKKAVSPPKTLSVIYIGAGNCTSCVLYSSRPEERGPKYSMKALKSFAESHGARFYHLQFGTYSNTLQENVWPDELKWVRQKTYAAGGTPRYLLVSDDKVYVNTHGTARMPTILDKIETAHKARTAATTK